MAVPEGEIHNERLAARATELDVDLLAIQEVDYFQGRSETVDQAALIATAMSAPYISRGFAISGTPGEKWKKYSPGDEEASELNGASRCCYGNGILSRIPILEEFRLELGRSKIGAPLAIPQKVPGQARPKIKVIYIHDEPRVAHAVHLANEITVINTHLSFVPGMNIIQLRKIHHWAKSLPGKKILVGDFNLPGKLPSTIMKWQSTVEQFTYPSWGARVQFDHILLSPEVLETCKKIEFVPPTHMVSDHLPLGIEILDRDAAN